MEIFLTSNCESLSGMLDKTSGYFIRATRAGRFFSQRSKHTVPPDGHWRFIVLCAEMAYRKRYASDIFIINTELHDALREAGLHLAADNVLHHIQQGTKPFYNARDIINLKITFGL